MDARDILRLLVERLEPEVGNIGPANCSYYCGDEPHEIRERTLSGYLHLASALRQARKALASGSHEEIGFAALVAPTYERTGRAMEQEYRKIQRQREARAMRQEGGRVRAAEQTAVAEKAWQPYQRLLEALVHGGIRPARARHLVVKQMEVDGFALPSTGDFPNDRSIRKWLPIKKFGSQQS
jgi:hypothetical protein